MAAGKGVSYASKTTLAVFVGSDTSLDCAHGGSGRLRNADGRGRQDDAEATLRSGLRRLGGQRLRWPSRLSELSRADLQLLSRSRPSQETPAGRRGPGMGGSAARRVA